MASKVYKLTIDKPTQDKKSLDLEFLLYDYVLLTQQSLAKNHVYIRTFSYKNTVAIIVCLLHILLHGCTARFTLNIMDLQRKCL